MLHAIRYRRSLLFLILSLGPAVSVGGVRHVNTGHPQASDGNPGTDFLPWRTLQHAARTGVPGDTVYIHAGVYHEHVAMDQSGTAESPVTYLAWPGDTVVLEGTGVTASGNGLVIRASHITIRGLEFSSWPGNAVWIEQSSYLEFSDCTIHNVTYGIGVADGSHDIRFTSVSAHDFDLYGFDVSPSGGVPCHDIQFTDCSAHSGRDPEQNVDGFALGHGSQYGFSFTRCTVHDVYDGFDISARNTVLQGCLAYNCWNGGYKLWQNRVTLYNCIGYACGVSVAELDWDGVPGLTTLVNCTFFDSEIFTVWVENSRDSLHMYNCIIAGGDNIGLAFEQQDARNYAGDYNIFHNDNPARAVTVGYEDEFSLEQMAAGEWTLYSSRDAHSLTTGACTALFHDPDFYDLRPCENSISVDAGSGLFAPAIDFAGNPRPIGAGYDIGAYEYQGTAVRDAEGGSAQARPILGRNYPNPFNGSTIIDYTLAFTTHVDVSIYNCMGQHIKTLVRMTQTAGRRSVCWDGTNAAGLNAGSGMYICMFAAGKSRQSIPLLLVR